MRPSHSRTVSLPAIALAVLAGLGGASRPALADPTFEVVKPFELPDGTPSPLVAGSDGALYGTTLVGGPAGKGTIFRIDGQGNFSRLHSFNGADGWFPSALAVGGDGALYGMTERGTASDRGTIFRIDIAGHFSVLHSFEGSGCCLLRTDLVRGGDGALYAAMNEAGAVPFMGSSTVFRIDAAGALTRLHKFGGTQGLFTKLVLGSDSALYGTATGVAYYNPSTFFRIDSAGNFTPLRSFTRLQVNPGGSVLVEGSDGAFYGTTSNDGAMPGTIFKITKSGNLTVLHSFDGAAAPPLVPLVVGKDGALYGSTGSGAPDGDEVFRIDSQGGFTVLHSFDPGGYSAPRPLAVGSDDAIYGATSETIFRVDGAGNFATLRTFNGADGNGPTFGALALGGDSALYGTTYLGGSADRGTIFKVDSKGNFTSVHSFHSQDGYSPQAALAVSDSALYGTTTSGGLSGAGTIFKIDRAEGFKPLHSFSGPDGSYSMYAYPHYGDVPPLVRGSDGALYGTTPAGGASGLGTVFRIDGGGAFATLHSFEPADGGGVGAALVAGSDETLYGSNGATVFKIDSLGDFDSLVHAADFTCDLYGLETSVLGPVTLGKDGKLYGFDTRFCGNGEVFSIDASIFRIESPGVLTPLHLFPSEECCPQSLVPGSDGALYGTSRASVFRIDSEGTFSSPHSFSYAEGSPLPALTVGSDGALYGITQGGSAAATIYRLSNEGDFSVLHSFDRWPGPTDLVSGCGDSLYGTIPTGGATDQGAIFRIGSTGNFSIVHSFSGTDGVVPFAHLVVDSDCVLSGTAPRGGPADAGVVYHLFTNGQLAQHIDFGPLPGRTFADPAFTVVATASSGLPVSLSASGSCSVNGGEIVLIGVGPCTVTASQLGDSSYQPAPEVSQSFDVSAGASGVGGGSGNLSPRCSRGQLKIGAQLCQSEFECLANNVADPNAPSAVACFVKAKSSFATHWRLMCATAAPVATLSDSFDARVGTIASAVDAINPESLPLVSSWLAAAGKACGAGLNAEAANAMKPNADKLAKARAGVSGKLTSAANRAVARALKKHVVFDPAPDVPAFVQSVNSLIDDSAADLTAD